MPEIASNLAELIAAGILNPQLAPNLELSRIKDKPANALLSWGLRELEQKQLTELQAAITRRSAPVPAAMDRLRQVQQKQAAQKWSQGDRDFFNSIESSIAPEDSADQSAKDEFYDKAADVILGTPTQSTRTPRVVDSSSMLEEQLVASGLQQQYEAALASGDEATIEEMMRQLGIDSGLGKMMMNYREPVQMVAQTRETSDSWFANFVEKNPLFVTRKYAGIPEINLDNPTPETAYWVRRIRAYQFYARTMFQGGASMNLDVLDQYSRMTFGVMLDDAPELLGPLVHGMKAVGEFAKAMKQSPEKAFESLAGQWDDKTMHLGMQGLLAVDYPISFESRPAYYDAAGKLIIAPEDPAAGEIKKGHEWFGPGEALAELRGENLVEQEFDSSGRAYFYDANGNKRTLEGLTPAEIEEVMINPKIRFAFKDGKEPRRFGRVVPAQASATKTHQEGDRTGAGLLIQKTRRYLTAQGFPANRITHVLAPHSDGKPLTILHPWMRDYAASVGWDMTQVSDSFLVKTALLNGETTNYAKALATLMQLDWTDDLRRRRDHQSEAIKKGVLSVFDQLYYNKNLAVARTQLDPLHNQLLAWKKYEVTVLGASIAGNPYGSRIPALNPISMDMAPIIPTLTLSDGTPIHKLPDDQRRKIEKVIFGTKYTQSVWRSQSLTMMANANILTQMVANGTEESDVMKIARNYNDEAIEWYGEVGAPQESEKSKVARIAAQQELKKQRRIDIRHVNFRELCELFEGPKPDLPDVEFEGIFGLMRFTEHDSARHNLMAAYEHGFKYMINYVDTQRLAAKGLVHALEAMNNAVDHRLEALFGDVPDKFESLISQNVPEALTKQAMNAALALMHARDAKATLSFVDEFAGAVNEEVWPAIQIQGESVHDSLIDFILVAHGIRNKAMEFVGLRFGGTGKGVQGDSVKMLEIDPVTLSNEQLELLQYALSAAGYEVNFEYGADPRDHIPEALDAHEAAKEVKKSGRKTYLPFVRRGMQAVLYQDVERNERIYDIPTSEKKVLGEYGHLGSERLWLRRVVNIFQDKLMLPNDAVDEIYRRLGIARELMSQEIIDRDQIELRLEAENNFIDSLRSIREYQQKQGVAEADLINVDEVYERLSAKD
jgi:hypothetical protein